MYFVAVGTQIVNLDRVTLIRTATPDRIDISFSESHGISFTGREAKLLHEHLMSFTNVLKEKENKSAES